MAEDKRSIIVYADWMNKFEALEDDEAGRLIKHFFRYVNDLNPVAPDRITELSFIDIEQSLKRDLKKWEKFKCKQSVNGKLGGRPKTETQKNPKNPGLFSETQKSLSVSDNVSDNVTVNVSVKTPQNLIDIFFNDLPTSSQLEQISRSIQIPKDKLILRIPEFRKRARIEYPNFPEFCNHFKNWVQKIPTEQQPIKRRQ